jgi:hypothetical protein
MVLSSLNLDSPRPKVEKQAHSCLFGPGAATGVPLCEPAGPSRVMPRGPRMNQLSLSYDADQRIGGAVVAVNKRVFARLQDDQTLPLFGTSAFVLTRVPPASDGGTIWASEHTA